MSIGWGTRPAQQQPQRPRSSFSQQNRWQGAGRDQTPAAPVDLGFGATPPTEADITTQYQQLLALIQQQSAPSTGADQYNQLMQMYQDQMAANQRWQQEILSQYDPNLGAAQHQQLMDMYKPEQRQSRAVHYYGY